MRANILALLCLAFSLNSNATLEPLETSANNPAGNLSINVLMSPVTGPTYTLSTLCLALLKFADDDREYAELQCAVIFIPGLGTTWASAVGAKGTSYHLSIKDVQNRKELLMAAQDSAAIFVATNGQTKKDPVLAAAMKLYDQAGGAELSDIEKAELIINAPEYF